jgi:hypothetical protein
VFGTLGNVGNHIFLLKIGADESMASLPQLEIYTWENQKLQGICWHEPFLLLQVIKKTRHINIHIILQRILSSAGSSKQWIAKTMKEAKRIFHFWRYKLSQFTTQDFKISVSTVAVQIQLCYVFEKKIVVVQRYRQYVLGTVET